MNNKKLGTAFERRVCELLEADGYWVHFLSPDSRGAQPFDIIAVKNGVAVAIDCKTLSPRESYFRLERVEYNQRFAFDLWLKCGNTMPLIYIEHGDEIKFVPWNKLKKQGKVKL